MKKLFAFAGIVVGGVFAAIVSFRLSTDALSIIVGAMLGLAAILPTIILVGFLLKKHQDAMLESSRTQTGQQPPVVVVSGGMLPPQYFQPQPQPHGQSQSQQPMLPPPSHSAPRKFRLMGYEDVDQVEVSDEEWVMAG
ncbi:MAG TPA: hypothetical protein ENK60_07825 [Anaerolineae bacterium]|nr:hypothetical protein [Anaerolineae bacterium]